MEPEVPDYYEAKKKSRPKHKIKLLNRRAILKILALSCPPLAGLGYSRYESNWIELTKKSIEFRGIPNQKKIKLLHISDIHLSNTISIEKIESALRLGFSESPDACFITGDFITKKPEIGELEKLSKTLLPFTSQVPTYACLGNHDGGSWANSHGGFSTSNPVKKLLAQGKVRLLVNQKIDLRLQGIPLHLVGVGDLWSDECHPSLCLTHRSKQPPRHPVILLCHNPDAKDILKQYFWNLMLAGHTHGGQFVVPFTKFAPFAPVVDDTIVEGLHRWDKWRHIHVTRGVGNLYGFRFNCRPEISLIELVSQ